MKKIITSDIEANNWINLSMVGLFDGENYFIFSSIKKYLDHLVTKKYHNYKVYFHNGGRYDFLFLLESLFELGTLKFIQKVGGFIAIFFESKNGIKLSFIDSYALLPKSLDTLIKDFGITDYQKIEVDFNVKHKFTDKVLREHLKNDCYSLYYILEKFYNQEGFLTLTISSYAMKIFLSKFFNGVIWNVSESTDKYFRDNFYKGGRVEVYKGYGKNLYYYDINSLYPSVMIEDMPLECPIQTNKFMSDKIGFYEVEFLQDTYFLISPISIKTKTGNYYVNAKKGEIYSLISNEILYLKKKNIKLKIISGYYFQRKAKIFLNYVNHYYNIKKNSKNETDRQIAKLMLNSLYGKFGQKLTGDVIEIRDTENVKYDFITYDAYNDLVLVHKDFNVKIKGVYISAYITSLARIKHLELMEKVGFESIYYVDTDSIVTSKKIKTSDKLGAFKLEAEIREGVFITAKTYGYIDKNNNEVTHYKGFTKNVFSYNQFKKLALNELKELKDSKERMLSFKECIKRKNGIKNIKGLYLKTTDQTKILKNSYDRRKKVYSKRHIFDTECFFKKDLTETK